MFPKWNEECLLNTELLTQKIALALQDEKKELSNFPHPHTKTLEKFNPLMYQII